MKKRYTKFPSILFFSTKIFQSQVSTASMWKNETKLWNYHLKFNQSHKEVGKFKFQPKKSSLILTVFLSFVTGQHILAHLISNLWGGMQLQPAKKDISVTKLSFFNPTTDFLSYIPDRTPQLKVCCNKYCLFFIKWYIKIFQSLFGCRPFQLLDPLEALVK